MFAGARGSSDGLRGSAYRPFLISVSLSPGGLSLLVGRVPLGEVRKRVKKEEYGLFFAYAGHASIYDYPSVRSLQAIAEDIWSRGGIVSAVCHGPAILPGIIDPKTSKSIIEGKTVTGFTTEGEVILHVIDTIRQDKVPTIEDGAAKIGAKYVAPPHPFDNFSIVDGRVVTGANPASAHSTAEKAIKAFDSL